MPTTILVVDDELGIRQALDRYLKRLGYRVVQADNGAAALQQIMQEPPQAMLCDIRMPQMTGVELVPKALAAEADLAIIMLTAIDDPKIALQALAAAPQWPGAASATERLAKELGTPLEELTRDIDQRRG